MCFYKKAIKTNHVKATHNVLKQLFPLPHASSLLTKHLYIIKHRCRAGRANAVVCSANVSARVGLAHCVDQQVAEQEPRVVMVAQVLPIFRPYDLRSGDATGHTLQHQPLAFGHHDWARRWWVNYTSGFWSGAWKRWGQSGYDYFANVTCARVYTILRFFKLLVYVLWLKLHPQYKRTSITMWVSVLSSLPLKRQKIVHVVTSD